MQNRLWNCKNPNQGNAKKVLCVCSAGLLRSPTAAKVLANEPFNFNTRSCGVHSYALIPIDPVLIAWADEIVCMSDEHMQIVFQRFNPKCQVVLLDIPDAFDYNDPELVELIKKNYNESLEE